jgi:hypothetical protein
MRGALFRAAQSLCASQRLPWLALPQPTPQHRLTLHLTLMQSELAQQCCRKYICAAATISRTAGSSFIDFDPSIDAVFEIEFVFSVSSPFVFEHSLAIPAPIHAIQQVGRR